MRKGSVTLRIGLLARDFPATSLVLKFCPDKTPKSNRSEVPESPIKISLAGFFKPNGSFTDIFIIAECRLRLLFWFAFAPNFLKALSVYRQSLLRGKFLSVVIPFER